MACEVVEAHREFRLLAMTYAGRIAAVKVVVDADAGILRTLELNKRAREVCGRM
jgi:hypothetical protein